jgi:NADH:ubiquinone oxidoreductase subunit K
MIVLFLFSVGLSTSMLFYKRPDAFKTPQFYAEDGTIFFSQAYHEGFNSINNIYSGYLHTYQRVVALLLEYSGMSYRYFPFFYMLAWLFPAFYSIYLLFFRNGFKPYLAFLFSLLPVCLPVHSEGFLNLTNVQWILNITVLLIALSKPSKHTFIQIIECIIIFLGITSSSFGIFLVLVFIYFRQQKQNPLIYLVSAVLAGIIQFQAIVKAARFNTYSLPFNSWFEKANRYIFTQITYSFTGFTDSYRPGIFYYIFSVLSFIVIGIWLVYLFKRKNHRALICVSLMLSAMALNIFATSRTLQSIHPMYGNMRYFYMPTFFFLLGILFTLNQTRVKSLGTGFIMVWVILINIYVFKPVLFPDYNWNKYAMQLDRKQKISAPILPGLFWKLELDPAYHRK